MDKQRGGMLLKLSGSGGARDRPLERLRPMCPVCTSPINTTFMDLASDVGVRHSVVLSNLNIHHLVDFSPAAVSIARELRLCVITIVVGWTTTRVISAFLNRSAPSDQQGGH